MRILIVSYRFPPYNSIGAVSVGKTAKYLERLGHDVRVLTADDQPLETSLQVEIDPAHVEATRWFNLNRVSEAALGGRQAVTQHGFSAGGVKGAVLRPLGTAYRTLVQVPDPQVGWYPYAVRAGRRMLRTWKPDLIFASAGPYTSLLVGARLARDVDVPWVAGFRDLWVDNPYREVPAARRLVETRLESRVVSSAAGLVTVSEPLAEVLRGKFDAPVAVVMNGYDDDDVEEPVDDDRDRRTGPLVLTYTGSIIDARRDPTPLFRAIARRGWTSDDIVVRFFGRYLHGIDAVRRAEGVERIVQLHPTIPYRQALHEQRHSDILLLLLWDDARERGVYSGKLFEYAAARRPLLLLGYTDGVAAELVRDRRLGVVANDADEIATALDRWIQQKRTVGIPDLPVARLGDLTRKTQTARLAGFLTEVVASGPPNRTT